MMKNNSNIINIGNTNIYKMNKTIWYMQYSLALWSQSDELWRYSHSWR